MIPSPPDVETVTALLRSVIDPELGADIVSLGMVPSVDVTDDGLVTVGVKLTIGGCPLRAQIKKDVETRVAVHPGVTKVKIDWGEMTSEERSDVMLKARWNARENAPNTEVPASTRILAVASGKGGVGKSSVTVNLAAAIAAEGFTVGVLDADIWGFSVPRLLGIDERLEAQTVEGRDKPMIIPSERPMGRGMLKVVSTGFLVDEDTALMWRGLMLNKAVEQFLRDVHWGDLDYLFIDMPPGTGDVQMGLARMLPRTDLLIVTTPAIAAQKVAARAADMARRSFLRVCGVIENMSSFTCDHGSSTRCSASAAVRRWPTRSASSCSAGCRSNPPWRLVATPATGGHRRHGAGRRRVPGDRPQDRRRGRAAGQHGRLLGAHAVDGRRGARRCADQSPSRRSPRRSGSETPR